VNAYWTDGQCYWVKLGKCQHGSVSLMSIEMPAGQLAFIILNPWQESLANLLGEILSILSVRR